MSRRIQRWPVIFDDHRAQLMRLAHALWKECVPVMVSLRTDSLDYAAVSSLQAATVNFSGTITGGQSWLPTGSTTSAGYQPDAPLDRDGEVDRAIADCAGDPRLAVRALLDVVARLEHDQERLFAQM